MKLVIAIVDNCDSEVLSKHLLQNHFQVTKLPTVGSFLNAQNTTLLIGCAVEQLEQVIEILKEHSHKRTQLVPNHALHESALMFASGVEVVVGGATIFVIDVERFEKI